MERLSVIAMSDERRPKGRRFLQYGGECGGVATIAAQKSALETGSSEENHGRPR